MWPASPEPLLSLPLQGLVKSVLGVLPSHHGPLPSLHSTLLLGCVLLAGPQVTRSVTAGLMHLAREASRSTTGQLRGEGGASLLPAPWKQGSKPGGRHGRDSSHTAACAWRPHPGCHVDYSSS